ncbi:MAG: hypothetical protein JWQ02_2068 [Capsulimonas sp.]|nr:hypothetical protein [Capsulimonas sp.]
MGYTLRMTWKRFLLNTLKTSALLTAATVGSIMVASQRETGSPWSAINSVTHVIDGDEISQPDDFSPRATTLGIVANTSAMVFWAAAFEGALTLTKSRGNTATGIAASVFAYIIDYHVVPKRLTPGIEKKLSGRAIFSVYAALAAAFAAAAEWRDNGDTPDPEIAIHA